MGSNEFQMEYIKYLQEQNAELLNRLNQMKQNYENKILSKDVTKHYLISALEEVLDICTVIPQEIDLLFDKITAALSVFKGLLLRKSELLFMVEKITKAINPGKFNSEQMLASGADEKVGAVKISPLNNDNLSRVPGIFSRNRKSASHQLSPIIEASPETSPYSSGLRNKNVREVKIPLERVNLSKFSEESPKTRFKGPKNWKKSLSSCEPLANGQRKSVLLQNNENLNKKLLAGESDLSEVPETDPLEGPSWSYKENSEMISSLDRFVDYQRRKRRFASVFDMVEDCPTHVEGRLKNSSIKSGGDFYEALEETDHEIVTGSSEDLICNSFAVDDKSAVEGTTMEVSSEKMPSGLRKEIFTTLNDQLKTEERLPKRSTTRGSNEEKKCKKSRTKRKAAPTFKLVEPNLKGKLRRS